MVGNGEDAKPFEGRHQSMIKVSICIPTRARHELAFRAFKSAVSQKYPNTQVVIVDNGNHIPYHPKWEELLSFQRVTTVKTPGSPIWDSWQFALDRAEGDLILFLNDKSILVDGAVEKLVNLYPRADIITWGIRRPWTTGSAMKLKAAIGRQKEYRSQEAFAQLFSRWDRTDIFPHGVNCAFSRSALNESLKKFSSEPFFSYTCPDYVAGIKLMASNPTLRHISGPITAIPRDTPSTASIGACVRFGRKDHCVDDYMSRLPEGVIGAIKDKGCPAAFVAYDLSRLGYKFPEESLNREIARCAVDKLVRFRKPEDFSSLPLIWRLVGWLSKAFRS